jgi:hypothetical protein
MAIVELFAIHPVCVELYSQYRGLGRFTLRYEGVTIASGIVTEISARDTAATAAAAAAADAGLPASAPADA